MNFPPRKDYHTIPVPQYRYPGTVSMAEGIVKTLNKRSSSPLPATDAKKMKENITHATESLVGEISKGRGVEIFERTLAKQIELVENLVFKDAECQKLKKKFEEVDRNCRRWHDFAIGLQSRVKRLALILHRQQDMIKSLQSKEVSKTDASTQTDCSDSVLTSVNGLTQNWTVNGTGEVKHATSATAPAVVIDLTDEETVKSSRARIADTKVFSEQPLQTNRDGIRLAASKAQRAGTIASQGGDHFKAFCIAGDLNRKTIISSNSSQANPRQTQFCAIIPAKNTPHIAPVSPSHVSLRDAQMNGQHVTPYPPLPPTPPSPANVSKISLPKPSRPLLKIKKSKDGIELSWNHPNIVINAKMESYELFVYQHNPTSSAVNRWKRIGNDRIKAMPLPMACTLSQFSSGSLYYFAVRGRDVFGRYGAFSAPCCSNEVQR